MPSETDLLNDALGQIGANRITAIDDGSQEANFCQTFYGPLRQALIGEHYWNFATTRAQLAQNVTGPLFGFQFSYALPADFLRLREYNGLVVNPNFSMDVNLTLFALRQLYRIESGNLVTNDGEVKIVYTRDEPNPDRWSRLFYQAFAAHMAAKLASAITKDAKRASDLLQMAENVLMPMAMAVESQDLQPEALIVDDLYWGR